MSDIKTLQDGVDHKGITSAKCELSYGIDAKAHHPCTALAAACLRAMEAQ